MRIAVHDFSGHPFQMELSRRLAVMGHQVEHWYCADFNSPKGRTDLGPDDPLSFRIKGLHVWGGFPKYRFVRRAVAEVLYGLRVAREVTRFKPDVLLLSNTPVVSQYLLVTLRRRTPQVHWWQDVYTKAVRDRFPRGLGRIVGSCFRLMESGVIRKSRKVVAIATGFVGIAEEWGAGVDKFEVVENWAPLSDRPAACDGRAWLQANGIPERFTFLYSGTLGLKHNPSLLATLAQEIGVLGQVVVVSEGPGADYLREAASARSLDNLFVMPFQPIGQLWNALDAASVLVAVLEPGAGAYSVPSKVLTYLAAGKPILLSVPNNNRSAQLISAIGAGLVVDPGDEPGFTSAALALIDDPARCATLGTAGKLYAEVAFDIERIALRFERILTDAVGHVSA